MRKTSLRLFLSLCLLLFGITLRAETVKVTDNDIVYTIDLEAKTASATGYVAGITKANIASSVRYDGTRYTVTSIGREAFKSATTLKSISLPKSVTTIEYGAFYQCTGLTSVAIPENIVTVEGDVFKLCSSLERLYFNADKCSKFGEISRISTLPALPSTIKEIIIGENVTIIPSYAFYGCSELKEITIPENVTVLGGYSFRFCTSLETVYYNAENCTSCYFSGYAGSTCSAFPSTIKTVIIGDNVKNIPEKAFYECAGMTECEIGNSVETIGSNSFYGCSGLTSIVIPDSVTSIESAAFMKCTGLESVVIGNSITSLPSGLFSGSSSLESVTFGDSVAIIGANCFYDCSQLTSMVIPNTVTEIGSSAFYRCSSLKTLTIGEGVISITSGGGFSSCEALEVLNFNAVNCDSGSFPENLKSVIFGDKVTKIPGYAFLNCSKLTTLTIPESVTSIGAGAFKGCTSLEILYFSAKNCTFCGSTKDYSFPSNIKTLVIGEKVNIIPDYTFSGCKGLAEVTIPETVTTIGNYAFEYCAGLETVYFNAENCVECGKNYRAFPSNITTLIIGDKVKNIPAKSFSNCKSLASVKMGSSVKTIGERAFDSCSGLDKVIASSLESWVNIEFEGISSNPTYYAKKLLMGEESIRRLTIPEGTTRLKEYAFINCEPLVTVNIPASLTSVGNRVFSGCTGLQRVIFPDEKTLLGVNYDSEESLMNYNNNAKLYIGSQLYDTNTIENIVIPESLNYIPDYAFYKWPKLTQITIHDNVERIGRYAFYECKSLASIEFPETLTEIGDFSFNGCYKIPSLDIPDNVTYIGDKAFYQCSALKSLTIGKSVNTIGEWAFYQCGKIPSVNIPASMDSIKQSAFAQCSGIKRVTIDDVNSWARISFNNSYANPLIYAKNLYVGDGAEPVKSVVIDGDEPVGAFSFYNAACLEKVRVKDGASIGEQAFDGCSNLNSICIDTNELGKSAFANCNKIQNIYVPVETPPAAFDNAFSNYEGVNLYVPEGCVSKYENAETCWWRFLDVYESDFADVDALFVPDYNNADSGVGDVVVDYDAANGAIANDIYNMQGVCVKRNATADDVKGLAPGLYIVGGKKVLVR